MGDRLARYVEFIERDDALDELVERMSGAMGACEGLPEVCRAMDLPYGRVLRWLMADEGRYKRYLQALEVQAHELVAETVRIADGVKNDVARDKLRVETRFRLAKHHASKLYGEKVEHQHVVVPVFQVNIVGDGGALIEGEVIRAEGGRVLPEGSDVSHETHAES